jgi:hypothetical protein
LGSGGAGFLLPGFTTDANARFDTVAMSEHSKSRLDHAVPAPGAAKNLTEDEKRAVELSGEIEQEDGSTKERKVEEAKNTRSSRP